MKEKWKVADGRALQHTGTLVKCGRSGGAHDICIPPATIISTLRTLHSSAYPFCTVSSNLGYNSCNNHRVED